LRHCREDTLNNGNFLMPGSGFMALHMECPARIAGLL
jgi:hypothetical protein